MRVGARGVFGLEAVIGLAIVEAGNALPFSGRGVFDLHQHLRQIAIGRRAADQIHMRRLFENPVALLLRYASQDAEFLPCFRSFL